MAIEQANYITSGVNTTPTGNPRTGYVFTYGNVTPGVRYTVGDNNLPTVTINPPALYDYTPSPNATIVDQGGHGVVTLGNPGELFSMAAPTEGLYIVIVNISLRTPLPSMRVLELSLHTDLKGQVMDDISTVDMGPVDAAYDCESLSVVAPLQLAVGEIVTAQLLLDGNDILVEDYSLSIIQQ